jgi:hypothetical protein
VLFSTHRDALHTQSVPWAAQSMSECRSQRDVASLDMALRKPGRQHVLESYFVMVFTLQGGRVATFQEFTDSAGINAAFARSQARSRPTSGRTRQPQRGCDPASRPLTSRRPIGTMSATCVDSQGTRISAASSHGKLDCVEVLKVHIAVHVDSERRASNPPCPSSRASADPAKLRALTRRPPAGSAGIAPPVGSASANTPTGY